MSRPLSLRQIIARITPHGDRKHDSLTQGVAEDYIVSLPLMGIGNNTVVCGKLT